MSDDNNKLVPVNTRRCPVCGVSGMVLVPQGALARYNAGELINVAMANVPAPKREQVKTGIHPRCWTRIWG